MRSRAALLLLFLAGLAAPAPAQTVTPLRTSGPRASSLNVVFLAEGYTAGEASRFQADADAKLLSLLADEAFSRFATSLNAYAVFIASEESGTDIPSEGITRRTYFNSSFGSNGIDRLLTIPPFTPTVTDPALGTGRVIDLLQQTIPDYDVAILIVNTPVYGGSGGFPSVASTSPASDEVLLHELGHSFAQLTDEYVDEAAAPSYPPAERINATQKTARAEIPWREFLLADTPLPTLDAPDDENRVGLYEGSHYRATGFYRPTFNNRMRSLGRPFGPVNLRAFAAAVHRLNLNSAAAAPSITTPPAGAVIPGGQAHTLRVAATGAGPLTYQWRRDGIFVAGATAAELTLTNDGSALAGSYLVEVTNAAGTIASPPATIVLAAVEGAPVITSHPASVAAVPGAPAAFSAAATGLPAPTFQWYRNGQSLPGANGPSLALASVRPADAGAYAVVATNAHGSAASREALLGVTIAGLHGGDAFSDPAWRDLAHPNGNRYSQVLLTGPAATVTADPGRTTRVSFIDLQDDIVQLEFSGAGTMTVTLSADSGPAPPLKYRQAVAYMKGHASVVIQGADATTNFAVFSVGPLTAVNQSLFRDDVTYDGHADLARLSLHSPSGRFGGIFAANAAFSDSTGYTGIYAPGVSAAGVVRLHDLRAYDDASPVLVFGATRNAEDGVRIAGGDMEQPNGRAVRLSGVQRVLIAAGTDSHHRFEPAQKNRARYERDGTDVTDKVVVPVPDP